MTAAAGKRKALTASLDTMRAEAFNLSCRGLRKNYQRVEIPSWSMWRSKSLPGRVLSEVV